MNNLLNDKTNDEIKEFIHLSNCQALFISQSTINTIRQILTLNRKNKTKPNYVYSSESKDPNIFQNPKGYS